MIYKLKRLLILILKECLNIQDLSLYVRKKKQNIEKLFFKKKFTADQLVSTLVEQGMVPGSIVMLHCAMNNFYNYNGSVDELIDKILLALGPKGTLCMPAYPYDKYNPNIIFDVRHDRTAAGLLAETFRKRPGVKRSLNKLHSVCAYGPLANEIVCEHHLSVTCFDEKSPFYKIASMGGMSIALGLPKYFIGTIGHVPDSLLREEMPFFHNKFTTEVEFTYKNYDGEIVKHKMLTKTKEAYIRSKKTKIIDDNFDQSKYSRVRLSNIWINFFDAKYLVERLVFLANKGITIYSHPHFY